MSQPAEAYEAFAVPLLFAPWAARLIDVARPRPGERVLDVGCGTGVVARMVASRIGSNGTVTGVDFNPAMLAVARTAAEQEHLKVEWRESRAESLPFVDAAFDVVLSQFALQFFADRRAALGEMHRVLVPGGRVGLSVWQNLDRHPFYRALHDVVHERLGVSGVQEIFSLGDLAELRDLVRGAGFSAVEIEPVSMVTRFPDPESFIAGEIAVDIAAIPSMQQLGEQERQAIVAAIRKRMDAPLRAVTESGQVVLEFHAHLARAVS